MNRTEELFNKYMKDIHEVSEYGARKHKGDGWLDEDGATMDNRSQLKSKASHAADSYMGVTEDHDSGLHPDLHLAWRAIASYIRFKEGIKHPIDKE